MENKHHMIGWWALGLTVGGALLWYLSHKKKPAVPGPPPAGGGTPGAPPGSAPPGPAAATGTGPAGTNVYSKPAALAAIRSSPEIDEGSILGDVGSLFVPSLPDLSSGNFLASVNTPNLFLGTMVGQMPDGKGDTDSSGNVWTWYQLQPSSYVTSAAGGSGPYYVRSDQVTLK